MPALAAETASGNLDLYGATFRYAGNGNASENIELNQGTNGKCSGSNLFQRVAGDRLIAIDYTGGGTSANFNVLTWVTSGACFVGNDTAPCWGETLVALDPSEAEGEVNQSLIPASENFISSGDVGQFQFAEFGVNLTAAFGISGCGTFAGTEIEARASGSSFVSGTKDIIIAPNAIVPCRPAVSTTADTNVTIGAGGSVGLTRVEWELSTGRSRLLIEDDRLTGVELDDGRVIARTAVFIRPANLPQADGLLDQLGVEVDEAGFIAVNATGRTSAPGVWAAGNGVDPRLQVIAGAGSAAAIAINADLVEEDVRNAARSQRARQEPVLDARLSSASHG